MRGRNLGRRGFLRAAGAVGAAAAAPALTSGCGSDKDDGALTFFFGANPEEERTRKRIIAAFSRKHPDIKIRTQLAGPDALQQVLTACAGGRCPDIMMAWELTYSGLATRGVLLDLNEQLRKEPSYARTLRADSSDVLYDTFDFDGGQYALPEQFAGVFLYNKKLFDEAGLKPPPARWEEAWTYEEFLDAARALTKRDRSGKTRQWGFVDPWAPYLSAGCFAMNNGVEWFSPAVNPTRTNLDDDRFVEGFQFYADLAAKHQVAPAPVGALAVSALDQFIQGNAGMALVGHWMYPAFSGAKDLDFDVTVLPVGPRGGTGSKSDVGTTGLAIAAETPRREEAWEFVKFATGPEGQAIIAESGLFIPVLQSAVESDGFKEAHTQVKNLEVFTGGIENANYLPITPAWGKIDALLLRESNSVLRGAKQAESFKDGLADDVNDLLSAV